MPRPAEAPPASRPVTGSRPRRVPEVEDSAAEEPQVTHARPIASPPEAPVAAPAAAPSAVALTAHEPAPPPVTADPATRRPPARGTVPASTTGPSAEGDDGAIERGATAPQLRRFIKSRAYVPMHELRRRFAINGADDEVTPVDIERRRVFVGLPEREGQLLGDLLRGGDIGYELSLDPITPIVVGVYPMHPVTRA